MTCLKSAINSVFLIIAVSHLDPSPQRVISGQKNFCNLSRCLCTDPTLTLISRVVSGISWQYSIFMNTKIVSEIELQRPLDWDSPDRSGYREWWSKPTLGCPKSRNGRHALSLSNQLWPIDAERIPVAQHQDRRGRLSHGCTCSKTCRPPCTQSATQTARGFSRDVQRSTEGRGSCWKSRIYPFVHYPPNSIMRFFIMSRFFPW